MAIKHYVLGFAFNEAKTKVVLIKKNRPAFQKGKLNGVGGKIETIDFLLKFNTTIVTPNSARRAMVREFKEETGVLTNPEDWDYFGKQTFENDKLGGTAVVHCFSLFSDKMMKCKTMESELVLIVSTKLISNSDPFEIMPNVPMLMAIALNEDVIFTEINLK